MTVTTPPELEDALASTPNGSKVSFSLHHNGPLSVPTKAQTPIKPQTFPNATILNQRSHLPNANFWLSDTFYIIPADNDYYVNVSFIRDGNDKTTDDIKVFPVKKNRNSDDPEQRLFEVWCGQTYEHLNDRHSATRSAIISLKKGDVVKFNAEIDGQHNGTIKNFSFNLFSI